MRRHDGCDDATSRAGGARGDIRGDRVVATAARAPQRASVDVVVLHLASAGPRPILTKRWAPSATDTRTRTRTAERGRETTGEPSAHALPRRTRACAPARRTRALALARRALALARGRAAFRDGREGCFLPGGRRASWPPRGTRLHTELVRAPYAFRRNPRWRARAAACVCSWTRSRRASRATCSWRRRWTSCRSTPCASSSRRFPRHPHPRDPRPRPSPHPSGYAIDVVHDEKSCIVAPRFVVAEDGGVPQRCATTQIKNMLATCVGMREGVRARACALLCCRGRGGGARDGRGGSTLPRGRGGGQRG